MRSSSSSRPRSALSRTMRARALATVAALGAALAACSDAPTGPAADPAVAPSAALGIAPLAAVPLSGVPTGKVVVVFVDSTAIPSAGLALVERLGGTVTSRFDEVGVAFVGGLSLAAITQLQGSHLVRAVGLDRVQRWLPRLRIGPAVEVRGAGVLHHDDPWQASYVADGTQWGIRTIQADRAWRAGYQGTPGTRVAILDTGIDYEHRELRGLVDLGASASFAGLVAGADTIEVVVPVEPQLPGDEPFMDNHFHGTHVAGTVASNNVSVAGVAPHATLIAVKVLNFQGSGSFESVATGIRYAAGVADADVINMSLGANVDPREPGVPALLELMARTIRWAEQQGAIVIAASGNDGLDLDIGHTVSTPCEQSTVCVSATGPIFQEDFDQPSSFTNYGITAIEVAAPGGNTNEAGDNPSEDLVVGACSRRTSEPGLAVCRANTDGVAYFYAFAAGTSMAAPHAAGVAALVKSRYPALSVQGVRSRLLQSADDVHLRGRDVYTNHGRVNAWRALGGR